MAKDKDPEATAAEKPPVEQKAPEATAAKDRVVDKDPKRIPAKPKGGGPVDGKSRKVLDDLKKSGSGQEKIDKVEACMADHGHGENLDAAMVEAGVPNGTQAKVRESLSG